MIDKSLEVNGKPHDRKFWLLAVVTLLIMIKYVVDIVLGALTPYPSELNEIHIYMFGTPEFYDGMFWRFIFVAALILYQMVIKTIVCKKRVKQCWKDYITIRVLVYLYVSYLLTTLILIHTGFVVSQSQYIRAKGEIIKPITIFQKPDTEWYRHPCTPSRFFPILRDDIYIRIHHKPYKYQYRDNSCLENTH